MWLINTLVQWWQDSYASQWYVNWLIKRHNINSALYTYSDAKIPPTLAMFIRRKYKQKLPSQTSYLRPLLLPIAGILRTHNTHRIQLSLLNYHYHRIHVPIGGKIHHYTNTQNTTTTIQIFTPDGLTVAITINTPHYPGSVILHYNKNRNYHVSGAEIGVINATKALITIQANTPLLDMPPIGSNLDCLTQLANVHNYYVSVVTQEKKICP